MFLEQKLGENLVVTAINSLASQLDKHTQETDNAIVQANHAVRVLEESDKQDKVLNKNVSSSYAPVNNYSRNQFRPHRYTDCNVYTHTRGQNIDVAHRNSTMYGPQANFATRGFYDCRGAFPMRQGMYSQRFSAGYDIPHNAYYGQSTHAGFNARPNNPTYWQGNTGNSNMLALPST